MLHDELEKNADGVPQPDGSGDEVLKSLGMEFL